MSSTAVVLENVERRRRSLGLTVSELSVRSRVPYRKLWYGLRGERIDADEIQRLNHVLDSAERASIFA